MIHNFPAFLIGQRLSEKEGGVVADIHCVCTTVKFTFWNTYTCNVGDVLKEGTF